MASGKKTWDEIAEKDAYFGVATHEKYRSASLDDEARRAFFESGREHVDLVFRELEGAFGRLEKPEKALDYGCGVGRILIPFAGRCERVAGVDISGGMLDESKRNLTDAGVENVDLLTAEDFLADDESRYDLVHSYIVLQHIEPRVGYGIIEKILTGLKPGGVGMIHVTHTDNAPVFTRLRSRIYRDLPFVHAALGSIRSEDRPFIPMYSYEMSLVKSLVRANGCRVGSSIETDHGYLGEMLFFRKES